MGKFSKALLWTIGVLVVVAILLRATLFKVWAVPDDPVLAASVGPTLAGGDTVLIMFRGAPGFGDLVRCADPENPERYTIGRIAGVERDIVELEGHRLLVNGKRYDNQSACPKPKFKVEHPTSGASVELNCDVVEMGGGWHYRLHTMSAFQDQKKTAKVGPGKVFLISDNRAMHDDSRDYGLVDRSTCKQRVFFRLWGKGPWSDDKKRLTLIH